SIPLFQCSDEMTIESYLESLEHFYPEIKNYASDSDQWKIILSLFNDPQERQNAVQIFGQVIVLLVRHISKINLFSLPLFNSFCIYLTFLFILNTLNRDEMLCNWMETMLFDEKDYKLFNKKMESNCW
ncbi:hypothetical protein RFI_15065, partial [Reticulomyxa filosa]